jgi:predicted acetyltransferase
VLLQKSDEDPLRIMDYAFLERDAGLRILTAVADHSSRIKTLRLAGGSAEPIIKLLPDSAYEMATHEPCMLRVVHVPRALEERGYPSTLEAFVHLDVSDDIVKENNGTFVLKVKDGRGKVEKGGEGRIKIDIRTLAQLYTCYMTSHELGLTGMLSGNGADLDTLGLIFAGPRPWTRDHF